MSGIVFLSIKAAACAGEPKGTIWTVRLGEFEQYTGLIYSHGSDCFAIETSRGRLVFAADELWSIQIAKVSEEFKRRIPITKEKPFL